MPFKGVYIMDVKKGYENQFDMIYILNKIKKMCIFIKSLNKEHL